MIPSPETIAAAAALLGVPADRLAVAVPLLMAMGGTSTQDELLAVASLDIEQAGLRAEIKAGRLACVKIGRALYVRRSALLALVAPRVPTAASPKSGVDLSDLVARERAPKKRRAA
jgi:hypothetical protein